jgi:hypothetical protein
VALVLVLVLVGATIALGTLMFFSTLYLGLSADTSTTTAPAPGSSACGAPAPGAVPTSLDKIQPGLDGHGHADQAQNAATIIAVAKSMGISVRGQAVGIMTSLTEAHLTNLPGGDGTSAGTFQIININGTYAQRTDPVWSARWFFTRLLKVSRWETQPMHTVAQAVQHSGFPDGSNYATWETLGARIAGDPSVAGATCTATTAGLNSGFPTGKRTIADLVAMGHKLQAMGITVSEQSSFGGVTPGAHVANSWHYRNSALDLNYDGHPTSEIAMFDKVAPMLMAAGFRVIWRDHIQNGPSKGFYVADHTKHLHMDIGL